MKPVNFEQVNLTLAEDQPEYLPLPVYKEPIDADGRNEGRVISCWKLTWRERWRVLFHGELWLTQLTFHQPLQPQAPSTESPFKKKPRIWENTLNALGRKWMKKESPGD